MSEHSSTSQVALELALSMTRLRARLRREQGDLPSGLSMSQLSALGRIVESEPLTASELAQIEHVRQQSAAETIAMLRAGGLVRSARDPSDGRKILLYATAEGRALTDSIVESRGAWLTHAIDENLTEQDQESLRVATEILFRLAESQPLARHENRRSVS